MKQTLQLRVSQHLALTPQLQQSIRLLQLSTLELHQELEQILSDNPLLERLDDPLDHSIRLLGDGSVSSAPTSTSTGDAPASETASAAEGESGFEAGEGGGESSDSGSDANWSFDDVARTSKAPEDDDARPQMEAHELTLREAQAVIRQCNPHPGSMFASDASDYVVPDVIVKRGKSGWQVMLNHDVMPRLRVNALYANILKQSKGEGSMSSQLQEAKWLIKNMRQRFDTILRVAQAIVDRQRNFFSHGAVAMRPLVLREIADTLGLHESTISR